MQGRTFIRCVLPRIACGVFCGVLCGALVACGGGGGRSGESTGVTKGTNVVGASTRAECEQAVAREASACFVIDGAQARMFGSIGPNALDVFNTLLRDYPAVKEIVMVVVPGGESRVGVEIGRALRAAKLNTRVVGDGTTISAGVDIFLAGRQRTVQNGAKVGVHSWLEEDNGRRIEGRSLPRNDPKHRLWLDYYRDIEFPNYEEFYFFTLAAAPYTGVHIMTPEEITKWKIATPIVQAVTDSSTAFVPVGVNDKIGPHRVNIAQSGTVYVRADAADTQFRTRGGVNHIDGGAGDDSIHFDGRQAEYTISRRGGKLTVVDSYYERNGIAVLENVERLEFRQATDAPPP